MTNRYWILGAGNWNDTTHWSDTSGGGGGFSVPGTGDTASIDANSGANFLLTGNINISIDRLISINATSPTMSMSGGNGLTCSRGVHWASGRFVPTDGTNVNCAESQVGNTAFFVGSGATFGSASNWNLHNSSSWRNNGTITLPRNWTFSGQGGNTYVVVNGAATNNNTTAVISVSGGKWSGSGQIFTISALQIRQGALTYSMEGGAWTLSVNGNGVAADASTVSTNATLSFLSSATNKAILEFNNDASGAYREQTFSIDGVITVSDANTLKFGRIKGSDASYVDWIMPVIKGPVAGTFKGFSISANATLSFENVILELDASLSANQNIEFVRTVSFASASVPTRDLYCTGNSVKTTGSTDVRIRNVTGSASGFNWDITASGAKVSMSKLALIGGASGGAQLVTSPTSGNLTISEFTASTTSGGTLPVLYHRNTSTPTRWVSWDRI